MLNYKKLNINNFLFSYNPYLISLLITLFIFSPIFLGFNFPLFSTDNLYGALPIIKMNSIMHQSESTYYPYALRGFNFLASISNILDSLFFKFFFFIKNDEIIFKLFFLLKILAIFFIGILSFFIIENIIQQKYISILCSCLVQLNIGTVYYLQIFPNIFLLLFFLIIMLLIQNYHKNSKIFNISLTTIFGSSLILSGHNIHSFFIIIILAFIFFYYFFQKKDYLNYFIIIFCSIVLTLIIALPKIYPLFLEILESNRIQENIIRKNNFISLRFFSLFFQEMFGSSLEKMNYLGSLKGLHNFRLNDFNIDFFLGHSAFHYVGTLSVFLSLYHILFVKKYLFWKYLTLFFILYFTFPYFGNIINFIFHPFHHGSIMRLGPFFMILSAGIAIKEIINNNVTLVKFKKFFEIFSKILIFLFILIFLYMTSVLIGANETFIDFFDILILNNIEIKIFIILISIILFFSYFVFFFSKQFSTYDICSKNYLFYLISLLTLLSLFFLTPIARLNVTTLYSTIFLIFIYNKSLINNYFKKNILKLYSTIILIFIIFNFFYYLILDNIGYLSIFSFVPDYPKNYYRINNGYIFQDLWRYEWFFLVLMGLIKFLYIFNFIKFKINKNKIFIVGIIFILLVDIIPAFLIKLQFISKPFVKIEYKNSFSLEKSINVNNFDYRFTQIHNLLNKSNLYNKDYEDELISNFPHSLKIPTYAGLNSQFDQRFFSFYHTFLKFSTDKKLYSLDRIGLAANIKNDTLLDLFGVKYVVNYNTSTNSTSIDNRNSPLSRFSLFKNYETVNNVNEAAEKFALNKVNYSQIITLETEDNFSTEKEDIDFSPLKYNHIDGYDKIKINLNKDICLNSCFILFNDNFNSNWKAYSKSKNYKIYPANGISMGIYIDNNPKEIIFEFKNVTFNQLKKISLIAQYILLIMIIIILIEFFLKKNYFRVS